MFRKADGGVFRGTCETGDGFSADECSTKLVGARSYIAGRDATKDPIGPQETRSPRDADGHGTHTASTAAGDADVPAVIQDHVLDTISGVAPAAKVAAYKVCWDGPDPAVVTDDGCQLSDIVAAVDQATADGADVINMSLGLQGRAPDVEQRALLGAASAGIFIAAAAGNSGPDAGSDLQPGALGHHGRGQQRPRPVLGDRDARRRAEVLRRIHHGARPRLGPPRARGGLRRRGRHVPGALRCGHAGSGQGDAAASCSATAGCRAAATRARRCVAPAGSACC
ncbi:S8 family serine peptidase [Clavibacter zhangzhiyongii]|uniref:S8 family serine peptidase n=1 Tax=Clavibacter zhangzhiyongii TaxID=2768071 RepID=UPI0039E004C9